MCVWVCVCSCQWMLLSFCPGPAPVASFIPSAWRNALLQDMSSCRKQSHTHMHICQKWSRLPLKGPDAHSWLSSSQPNLHTEAQRASLFFCCFSQTLHPRFNLWMSIEHVCRASGGTELMMSSWEAVQSFHYVTVPWKIVSAPNRCCFLSSRLSLQEALQLSPPVSLACVRGSPPLLCQWACPSHVCQWLT